MTLYILKYNNYYNRIVKSFDTMEEYEPYVTYTLQATNFNPNDGVDTQHVFGVGEYDGTGDYLIALDEDGNIASRWFIIDTVRTRAGQYQVTLHRDLVVDYTNVITNSPMYIEKATLTDSDPMIWNNEGVSVNQIKTNEYTLQDDSRCAWIVGYMNRDDDGGDLTVEYSNPEVNVILPEGTSIYDYVSQFESYKLKSTSLQFEFGLKNNKLFSGHIATYNNNNWSITGIGRTVYEQTFPFIWRSDIYISQSISIDRLKETLDAIPKDILNSVLPMYINTGHTFNYLNYEEALKQNGKIVQTSDGKQYKLSVKEESTDYVREKIPDITSIDSQQGLPTYMMNKMKPLNKGTPSFNMYWTEEKVTVTYTPASYVTSTVTIPTSNSRAHLNDAPYDMFCIPYSEEGLSFSIIDSSGKYNASGISIAKDGALSVAQSIGEKMGKGKVYDIQLLPYCPLEGWYIDNGVFTKRVSRISETGKGGYVSSEVFYDTNSSIIVFFSTSSSGSYNSEQIHVINSQTNEELTLPLPIENKKLTNECDIYRLCSPNYNGQFQFNSSKIGGISGFNVDYTYVPHSPYIKISPNFGGLYGQDFDDSRGLICQGDFSISYLSDAWETYKVQNKNYLNIFNRQVENMEVTQDVQRKQQVFNAVTGSISGGISGAMAGSAAGPYGAIAGAVVGTAASSIGGALDVKYGDILRNEALDYTKDMFNYQLDNIKALPDSLANVTAFTKNNKIFPILEYYTCTEEEKLAIANKIAYNGMTVMRIGKISDFISNTWSYKDITSKNYIKGQLIRFNDDGEDYHIVKSIANELYKGVYLT